MNFATQLSATPSSLGVVAKGSPVSPLDDAPAPAYTLAQLKARMQSAYDDITAHLGSAVQSGVQLGAAALQAKEQVPHGEFGKWVDDNFTFSSQWVRTCMRAAEAWELGVEAQSMEVLEAPTVEKLAAQLRPLKGAAPIVAKKRKVEPADVVDIDPDAPPKPAAWDIVAAPKGNAAKDKALDDRARSLDLKDKDLRAFERKLDKLEKTLLARQAELDERERVLTLREAIAVEQPAPSAAEQAQAAADEVAQVVAKAKKPKAKAKAQKPAPADEAGQEGANQDPVATTPAQTDTTPPEGSGTAEQEEPM